MADCVGRKKSTGVVFLEFFWRQSQADVMFVFLEFYSWRLSEAGVVFLEFYWRPCEPAGSVPRSLWMRFGRFGGRQEREIECKEETLTRL